MMTRRTAVAWIVFLFAFASLAHTGAHTFLGTVVKCEPERIVIKKKDGGEATFLLSKETAFERDGHRVSRDEVVAGTRVSVAIAHDGKTALKVKLAPKKN